MDIQIKNNESNDTIYLIQDGIICNEKNTELNNILNKYIGRDIITNVVKCNNGKYGLLLRAKKEDNIWEIIPFAFQTEKRSSQIMITFNSISELKTYAINYQLNVLCADISGDKITYNGSDSKLLINGKDSFYPTRNALEIIIQQYMHIAGNREYIAINMFSTQIQDFLVQYLYGYEIILSEDIIEILSKWKSEDFAFYNEFLRGGYIYYITDLKQFTSNSYSGYTIDVIVKDLLIIHELMESIPKPKKDILITRLGQGKVLSGKKVGDCLEYSNLVSFSTGSGTLTKLNGKKVVYRRILSKNDKALPIELLCQKASEKLINSKEESEGEMLVPPFNARITKINHTRNTTYVSLNYAQELDFIKLIIHRLDEYREHIRFVQFRLDSLQQIAYSKYKKCYVPKRFNTNQYDLFEIIEQLRNNNKLEGIMKLNAEIKTDLQQYDSYIHGYRHTQKVNFFINVLAFLHNLDDHSLKILNFASKKHDIGRQNDDEDSIHGENGIEMLKKSKEFMDFSKDDQDLICFLITEHCKSSEENEKSLKDLEEYKTKKYRILLAHLKDADKLDRIRLGIDELDMDRLSLNTSKKLVKVAIQCQNNLDTIFNIEWIKLIGKQIEKAYEMVRLYKTSISSQVRFAIQIQPIRYEDDCKEAMRDLNNSANEFKETEVIDVFAK